MTMAEEPVPTPGSIDEHFNTVSSAGRAAMSDALAFHRAELGRVHQADLDIASWAGRTSGPVAGQLQAARRELALAEYCAATGLYRQAYASLRLFLELSFASVHFSVNEFERRLWASDRLNFSWSNALSDQDGLLSVRFVREFAPSLEADAQIFGAKAAQCYRHCSQFVHGKARHSQTLPQHVSYSAAVVTDWCSTAFDATESVLFLLLVRYGQDFDVNGEGDLQDTVVNHFGHVASVRMLLALSED